MELLSLFVNPVCQWVVGPKCGGVAYCFAALVECCFVPVRSAVDAADCEVRFGSHGVSDLLAFEFTEARACVVGMSLHDCLHVNVR